MERKPATVLIMATTFEAKPFISGLGLEEKGSGPFPVFSRPPLTLIVCGIGKTNAAAGTAVACTAFGAGRILNLGAAGAVDRSAETGAIFQISKIIEPDRPSLQSAGAVTHTPDTLGEFPTAVLATQDRPIIGPGDRSAVSPFARLADMEAAAVVQVSRRFGIPCTVFKFVSDTPNHADSAEIIKNIKHFRTAFFQFFKDHILPELDLQNYPEGAQ